MKKLRLWLRNFFRYKDILLKDHGQSLQPSLSFLKLNLIERCQELNKKFQEEKEKDYELLEKLREYSRVIEIIGEIEDDIFLESVGFEFKESPSKYKGTVEWQDELFEQWEVEPLPEKVRLKNLRKVEDSIVLEKREWHELRILLKKIIDQSGV